MLGFLPKGHPHEVLFTRLLFVLSSGMPPATQQTEMLRLGTGTRREVDSRVQLTPLTTVSFHFLLVSLSSPDWAVFNKQKFI